MKRRFGFAIVYCCLCIVSNGQSQSAYLAATIGFIHPKSGEKMSFTSDLPQDMQTVIDRWTEYTNNSKQ